MKWFIDKPPPDTQTRGRTASGSRVEQGRASTAQSEKDTAGLRPARPEPPSAGAASYLEDKQQEVVDALFFSCVFKVRFVCHTQEYVSYVQLKEAASALWIKYKQFLVQAANTVASCTAFILSLCK